MGVFTTNVPRRIGGIRDSPPQPFVTSVQLMKIVSAMEWKAKVIIARYGPTNRTAARAMTQAQAVGRKSASPRATGYGSPASRVARAEA